ncbi:MAG: hypothetical protein ABSA06_12560 [Geobacteraceae bacterium]
MKGLIRVNICALFVGFSLLLVPAIIQASYQQTPSGAPPVAQPLIREGNLAVSLAEALNLGTAKNEAEAESWLGEKDISPKNGWIADYPVTPDILGELNMALGDAADAGKIALNRVEALQRLDGIVKELGVSVTASENGANAPPATEDTDIVPPTDVYDYYNEEGPPVVTYYAPPPDYYYLYSWVPYPFWCDEFWFSGFFILNDFHRSVFFDHGRFHGRGFISNHFRDGRSNRFGRIDPVTRSGARSFTGMRASARNEHDGVGVRANIGNTRSNLSTQHAQQSAANRSWQSYAHYGSNRNVTWGRGYNFPSYRASFAQSGRFATSGGYAHPVGSYANYRSYAPSAGSFAQRSSFSSSFRGGFSGASSFRGGGGFSGGHGGGGFTGGHGGGGFSGGHGGGRR